jgi:hypothetical protein
VSSRLEDLRDLAVMLDEGKVTQEEYDIVKAELLDAPGEEWEDPVSSDIDTVDNEPDASRTELGVESWPGSRRSTDWLLSVPPWLW